jgi:Ca2+-binding EF-hand superfamily protein
MGFSDAALALSSGVFALTAVSLALPSLETLDANHDGVVSRSEAAALPALEAAFDRLDHDGNGVLDAPELEAATRAATIPRSEDEDDSGG